MALTAADYSIDDLAELKEYLGDAYDHRRLERWEELVEEELASVGDEATLYRSSEAYLYDLTVFAMSGTKLPYLAMLERNLEPGARILDYGCGIGADGLRLLERGYEVAFADFDNPSTRYLRWRLDRRGIGAPVYDLERDTIPRGFDAAFAFDVIEHVDDPVALLTRMESHARLVAVNLLESLPEERENPLHRELPIDALLLRAAERTPFRYERHHGRSNVVLYGTDRAGRGTRAMQRARIRIAGKLRRPRP